MALSSSALEDLIKQHLQAAGFNLDQGQADDMARAVAEAVVEHIQSAAEVHVTSGSSAGTYGVQ